MNSDPNGDSKQSPESKLGQVHSVHIHGPGCKHAVRWVGRIVASVVVSWRTRYRVVAMSQACTDRVTAPSGPCISLCCATCHRALACAAALYVTTSSAVLRACWLYHSVVSRACPAVLHLLHGRVVACLATHPAATLCAHVVRRVVWPVGHIVAAVGRIVVVVGSVMVVAWPYRGPCSCAQLPCVMIQSIVS